MNPLLRGLLNWLDSSCISAGANWYGALATALLRVPSQFEIQLVSEMVLPEGLPEIRRGKSQTSGMSLISFTSFLASKTRVKNAQYSFCKCLLALMQDTTRPPLRVCLRKLVEYRGSIGLDGWISRNLRSQRDVDSTSPC